MFERIRHSPNICRFCMSVFSRNDALISHLRLCTELSGRRPQKYAIPLPGEQMSFTNYEKQVPHRLVGAVDFETRLLSPEDLKRENIDLDQVKLFPQSQSKTTEIVHYQLPISYSLVIYDQLDCKIIFERTESTDNGIMNLFFSALQEADTLAVKILNKIIPCVLTMEKQAQLRSSTSKCYLCKESFYEPPSKRKPLLTRDPRFPNRPLLEARSQLPPQPPADNARQPVIDHDHFTGKIV